MVKSQVVKLMTPLLVIAVVGGTVSVTKRQRGFYKLYTFGLICGIVLSYLYLSYGKFTAVFQDFSFLIQFSDQMSMLFLILGYVSCIISVTYANPNHFVSIINQFAYFDYYIGVPVKTRRKCFWITLVAANIEIIGLLSADSWIWLDTLGIYMYHYYLLRNIQLYFMEMRKIIIFWIISEICLRFKMLRTALKDQVFLLYRKEIHHFNQTQVLKNLKKISKLSNYLCDTCDLLSKLYGLVLFFDVLFIITISIEYSILMISLTIANEKVNNMEYGFNLKCICYLWIFECFVSKIMFTFNE